jgi:hypothetical protein
MPIRWTDRGVRIPDSGFRDTDGGDGVWDPEFISITGVRLAI